MDVRQLRCLCLVAEKKSFTVAARHLGLSQPSVSFQIASLEQELGTKLFDRQGKETTITPSGKVLYEYGRKILKLFDEAEQAIDQLKGLIKGKVVIGASTIPGEYILPELLREFWGRYQGIQVELIIGDTRGILDKIIDNEVELGVVGAVHKSDKLVFIPFADDRLVIITPADSQWFHSDTVTLEQLKRVPFVLRESGSGTRSIVSQKLRQKGLGENELDIVMTLGSTTAVKRAVEGGVGVAIVSERAVERELKTGTLKKVELGGVDMSREFLIAYRSGRTLPPAAASLLQFLQEKKSQS